MPERTIRLPHILRGPYPRLPRPLDAVSDHWSRLRPRVRLVLVVVLSVAAVAAVVLRLHAAESRWGGPPVTVWVAATDTPVGAVPTLRKVQLPPGAVPPAAQREAPDEVPLALALPDGAVLTELHVSTAGPAAGLAGDLRVVPIPVEDGWGVASGGQVDVWVLDAGEEPAVQVASARPVLEVRRDQSGAGTALVGLAADEVAATTSGLALGKVLLTHAPPQ